MRRQIRAPRQLCRPHTLVRCRLPPPLQHCSPGLGHLRDYTTPRSRALLATASSATFQRPPLTALVTMPPLRAPPSSTAHVTMSPRLRHLLRPLPPPTPRSELFATWDVVVSGTTGLHLCLPSTTPTAKLGCPPSCIITNTVCTQSAKTCFTSCQMSTQLRRTFTEARPPCESPCTWPQWNVPLSMPTTSLIFLYCVRPCRICIPFRPLVNGSGRPSRPPEGPLHHNAPFE